MANIEKSIDVEVPVRTAYNQWTQFEEFPSFMEGVTAVTQLDDRRLRWQANIGGKAKDWTAEITEQRPDERRGVEEHVRGEERGRRDLPPPRRPEDPRHAAGR